MTENTKIEWADHTFNHWLGCTKVSPACDHCYAEIWAKRTGNPQLWQGARRRTTTANWRQPLKWNAEAEQTGERPRVFCASMADVFDNQVPDEWRADLWDLIELTPRLEWLLLTKRIGNAWRMQRCSGWFQAQRNARLGITICNQEEADRDIPKLLQFAPRSTFLSIEPARGPTDLRQWLPGPNFYMAICEKCGYLGSSETFHAVRYHDDEDVECPMCGSTNTDEHGCTIDWVIAGGESGPGARPSHPQWFRELRDQCVAAGVPFLFKQWGNWLPSEVLPGGDLGGDIRAGRAQFVSRLPWDGTGHAPPSTIVMRRFDKKVAGRELDGRTWDEFPRVA